ncbi:MAG: tetratricopeptide repeat protein [Chloroflexi bacterium]|nr:tetratricopeptide repeat protein [Chloroflexota bacterium]MBM4453923.1 tetratricopeptide repeat protein [Chloroflexota bacterium]
MAKKPTHWQLETLSSMTTEAIVDKFKELVPDFDLSSFLAKTDKYLACEDLSEEEYYPRATFSDFDEDFIWMACEELWKRLVPDRPSVEHVADQFDDLVEKIIKAAEKRKWKEVVRLSQKTLDLICQYTIEIAPAGHRLRRDFYEKLREATFYDFDSVLEDLIFNLMGNGEYKKIIDIAGTIGDALGDDRLLDYKAESLFALGKRNEAERCYQAIINRNPDNPWVSLHAGDCYVTYGEKDISKAKMHYLKALSVAESHRKQPDSKDELRAVYHRLIALANDSGDYAEADRYQHLLNSIETKKVGRNDPCPCGSGKKYKKCCGHEPVTEPKPPFLDRRMMERDLLALKQAVEEKGIESEEDLKRYLDDINKAGKTPQWIPETPLEKAQNLIFEALETEGKRRYELVRQALKISPDCADAYILLAEETAQSLEEERKLYEAGVKAAERTLGSKTFEEEAGHFWSNVETRPYMRARTGLAQCLWFLGKRQEAIEHYHELLRLNPNDNQGIRYLLAASLLEMGEIDTLQKLLGQYDETTAACLYTKALVSYVRQGDTAETRRHLREAMKYNPHVAPYILSEKKLPRELPQRMGFGTEDEAIVYAAEFGLGWRNTKGALEWLRTACGRTTAQGKQSQSKVPDVPEVFLRAFDSEDGKRPPKRQTKVDKKGKQKQSAELPLATIALYGPDDTTPTKVTVGIIKQWEGEPTELKRWWGENVIRDPVVRAEILEFIKAHGAKSVVATDGIIGCPHEEGIDFTVGEDCPYCPFWRENKHKRQDSKDTRR